VTFGVLTTDSAEHAVARSRDDANNKGGEAAMAALEMIHLLKNIPKEG
jgi:6,7-dimethyl-8-ribityllumazine synthase